MLAARDVVRRVSAHHVDEWEMEAHGYYTKSFVYRLLRPIAIGHLIQEKMNAVDFSVDDQAIELLHFTTTVERLLTGDEIVLDHPEVDWSDQTQHLFRDNLRAAAGCLIDESSGTQKLLDFAEFDERIELLESDRLRDLAKIFDRCESSLTENSIFWIRLVGYAYVCAVLVQFQARKGAWIQESISACFGDDSSHRGQSLHITTEQV